MTTEDKIAAAIIGFLGNLLPFLVITHVIMWTADTISACMLVVTSGLTMAGLIYQAVQHKPLTVVAPPVAPSVPTIP